MVRPTKLKDPLVTSTRIEKELYERMQEIAALESSYSGRKVSTQDLMREAMWFVYGDGERLRECLRRSRQHANTSLLRYA